MGWWSTDIFGGDDPLDVLEKIEDVVGVKNLYPLESISKRKQNKVKKNWNWENIVGIFYNEDKGEAYFIEAEVVAVVAMACAVQIDDSWKEILLEIIKNDDWSNYDTERKVSIDELVKTLEGYDGKSTILESKGLIDTMLEKA